MNTKINEGVTLEFTTKDGVTISGIGTLAETPKIEREDEIYLIIGKHNSTNQVFYWLENQDEGYVIGDYAIVENKGDYDLVKIIGTAITQQKYLKWVAGVNVNKKVVKIVERNEIRED